MILEMLNDFNTSAQSNFNDDFTLQADMSHEGVATKITAMREMVSQLQNLIEQAEQIDHYLHAPWSGCTEIPVGPLSEYIDDYEGDAILAAAHRNSDILHNRQIQSVITIDEANRQWHLLQSLDQA